MQTHRQLDTRISRHATGGGTFVDLGCGDGCAVDELCGRFEKSIGIDHSTARMSTRSAQPVKWTFLQADLNATVPLESNTIDVVLANQVIEHIVDPHRFVGEIYRILRPGGKAIVTTPNIRYIKHLWHIALKGRGPRTANDNTIDGHWDDGHIHYFTHSDLRSLFLHAGFSVVTSSALIDIQSKRSVIRVFLDSLSGSFPVREFLSGNILLVAIR